MSAIIFYQGGQQRILRSCRQRTATQPTRLWTSPAPSGERTGTKKPYLFLLFQFISGGPPDESRCKKRDRTDYHWRSGAASFVHQKGKNQGKANSGPSVVVKDWQFAPLTYDDVNGANPGVPGGVPQNGYGQPGGAPVPNQQGGYPTPAQEAIHRQPVLLPAIMHLQAPHRRTRMAMHGEAREEQMLLVATYHRTVTDSPRTATLRILEAHRITHRAIRTSSLPAAMLLEAGQLREHRAAIRKMASPRLQNSRQSSFLLLLDADTQKI